MRKPSYPLILAVFLLLSVHLHVSAQAVDIPMFAAYAVDDNLYIFKPNERPQFIDHQPYFHESGPNPRDLVWNHDGNSLAFEISKGIAVFDVAAQTKTNFLAVPFPELPLAFSLDDKYILYAGEGGGDGINGPYWRDISKIEISPEAKSEKVGQIAYSCCFGGGEFIPPAVEALDEEQGNWHGVRSLHDTPYGILAAKENAGVQLNGIPIELLNNAYLSHNRDKIASIADQNRIAIVDLETREIHYLQLDISLTTLAWGENDKTLFYASSETIHDMYADLTQNEKQVFLSKQGSVEYELGQPMLNYNHSNIYQLNLSDETQKSLTGMEVYAIARLMPSPDGTSIFFSVIPNMDKWLQVTLASQVSCYSYACSTQYSRPMLYSLSLADGEVNLVGDGLYNAAFSFENQ
ncbi:MAG: hypothetical protein ABI690_06085 [Chloroflexota bacterium]